MPKLNKPNGWEALNKYRRQGFKKLNRPGFSEPKLPLSLSGIASNDLGDLMGKYGAWRDFTEDLLSEALTEVSYLEETFNFTWKKEYLLTSAKNRDEKAYKVDVMPHITRMRKELSEAKIYAEMLSAKLTSYNNIVNMLSREISRRGSNF